MSARETSGGRAVGTGKRLEDRVEKILAAAGFEIIPFKDWRESIPHERKSPRIAVLDAPYKSLYGGRAYIEFRLIIDNRCVYVEAKHQGVGGSYDEKLAYVYLTAKANLAQCDYVLVMDGNGWRAKARAWIEQQAKNTPGLTVLRLHQFAPWLAKELPGAR